MSAMPFAPGELVADKYRVERILGEGGYGVVLAAEHVVLGGRVAIKVLRPEMLKEQEVVERFLREGRAAVRIKGEHVTRVLDVGATAGGVPYMVMEYLDGNDLGHVVDASGPMPIATAVDYILQTCEALAEAHGLGIIHRDIKPSNLFLTTTADGMPTIKVLDFGISKLVAPDDDTAAKLTQTQSVLGSPQYMAPEQMRSSRKVDARTDIWALGGTLFELVTGRPPFDATTMAEIFAQILQDAPPKLVTLRPDASPELGQVLEKCLEKQPERRFNDIQELAMALAPFSSTGAESSRRIQRLGMRASQTNLRALTIPTPPSFSAVGRTQKLETAPALPKRSSAWVLPLVVGVVAALGIIGGGAVIAMKRRHPAPVPTVATVVVESVTPTAEPPPPVTGVETTPTVEPSASSSAPTPKRPPHLKPAPTAPPKPTGVASSRYD